jgi:hypothetical protein
MSASEKFAENVQIVRDAIAGLPDAKLAWQRETAQRSVLVAMRAFQTAVSDNSDIADELGVIDAFHALPGEADLPPIPDISPMPTVSADSVKAADTVADLLKVAEVLELDESDVAAATELLADFQTFRPTSTKSGGKGRSTSNGTTEQIRAEIRHANGETVIRRGKSDRPDSLRMSVREVIGDVGVNDQDFKSAYTAAQNSVVKDRTASEATATHPNGSTVTLTLE